MGNFFSKICQPSPKIQNTPNSLSYSSIPKLDDKYKDLNYEKLQNYINKTIISIKKYKKNKGFSYDNYKKEYEILVQNVDDDIHIKCLLGGFKELCRYSDIKTYVHNNLEINTEKKYINASPINIINDNYFIATQGPKPNTIEDFWTMIEQYNCNIIIMLCKIKELGAEKCALYWDAKTEKFFIELLSEEEKKFDETIIIERKIKLINNLNKNEKTIIQLHYMGWPDYGVPNIQITFNAFLFIIGEIDKLKGNGSGVIHCSAGVGRTGTFISMYFLYKEIMAQISDNNLKTIHFSVFNMVRKLKEMRLYMVQNSEQYKFIYDFINYLLMEYNK